MSEGGEGQNRAHEEQLKQAVDTFRFQMGLVVQFFGFLIAADAVLVCYALSQKKAVLFFVASVMPLLALRAVKTAYGHGLPLLYVALYFERKILPSSPTLAASYARTKFPSLYERVVKEIDAQERTNTTIAPSSQLRFSWKYLNRKILAIVLAVWFVHAILFVLGMLLFNYPFM